MRGVRIVWGAINATACAGVLFLLPGYTSGAYGSMAWPVAVAVTSGLAAFVLLAGAGKAAWMFAMALNLAFMCTLAVSAAMLFGAGPAALLLGGLALAYAINVSALLAAAPR